MFKRSFGLTVFTFLWSGFLSAQSNSLPEPQTPSSPGAPPPPGLVVPIDSKITLLIAGGIFLGIYFIRAKKPA